MLPESKPLKADILTSSFVSHLRRIQLAEKKNYPNEIQLIGGIYDQFDVPHSGSLLRRRTNVYIQAHEKNRSIDRAKVTRQAGPCVYGGLLFDHYGHFVLETLARAWFIGSFEGDVYFYKTNGQADARFDSLALWQQDILASFINDTNRIKFISSDIVFDKFIVPEPGFVSQECCFKRQATALFEIGQKLVNNTPLSTAQEKIWLSRSLLKTGLIADETKFEMALQEEGFFICHPELYSVTEQIQFIENASVVAGFTGSAFHTILFAKNNGAKLIHLHRFDPPNKNYLICAEATEFNADFYSFFKCFDKAVPDLHRTLNTVFHDFRAIWDMFYQKGLVETANLASFSQSTIS